MPGVPVTAPYDSLATVTQLVRVVLGDFIQNLNPNLAGVVSTDVTGKVVTLVSGSPFSFLLGGGFITINNVKYPVLSVPSLTQLVLGSSAGTQLDVNYSAIISLGDIFADSQPYVLPTINLAWRHMQKKLDYASHPRMRNEVYLYGIPAAGSTDPVTQSWISWTEFFNGANIVANGPVLPSDFLAPMNLQERVSQSPGVANNTRFQPMRPATDGLPSCAKGTYNRVWDWREDALYFVGTQAPVDLRIQYQAYLADIVPDVQGFAYTQIPILRAAEGLAYYSAAIFVAPRGGELLAPGFENQGDMATDAMTNRSAKVLQRGSYRRRAVYDSSGHYRARRY